MALRRPVGKDNLQSMDRDAFAIDETSKRVYRAVADELSHSKLDAIAGALGAATNTIPTIYNLNIILADTEYQQALPANTKTFILRSRNKAQLKLAYVLGGTNTTYLTIPVGSSFEDSQFYTGQTIYVQSTKPGDIIEIVAYS